jgi:hypothetical protein
MRGALCPTSSRRRVGIVASKGWSGWVAVAAGLGWDIAWVAVEDSQLGQAWRRDLATQAIRHLPYQEYSPTLVSDSGVDVLLLNTQLPVAGPLSGKLRRFNSSLGPGFRAGAPFRLAGPLIRLSGLTPIAAVSRAPLECYIVLVDPLTPKSSSPRSLAVSFPAF